MIDRYLVVSPAFTVELGRVFESWTTLKEIVRVFFKSLRPSVGHSIRSEIESAGLSSVIQSLRIGREWLRFYRSSFTDNRKINSFLFSQKK